MTDQALYSVRTLLIALAILTTSTRSNSQTNPSAALQQFPELQSDDASKREAAAKIVGAELSPQDAVPSLIELVGDGDRAVRIAAIDSLAKFGSSARGALSLLMGCTRDVDDEIRKTCVAALGRIEVNDQEVLMSIKAALKDPSVQVRLGAVPALAMTAAPNHS